MATPGGPPPPVPGGWQVNWSDGYNQWFYTNTATGAWQWEHPLGPPSAAQSPATTESPYSPPAQSPYSPPGQQPYPPPEQQPYSPPAQPQDGQHTAPVQGEEFEDGSRGFGHGGHHVFGTMAGLITAAGAGALGAKLFGGMKHDAPVASPPPAPSPYPAWSPGAPTYAGYQGYPTPPPGVPSYPGSPYGQPGYPPPPQGAPLYPAASPGVPVYSKPPPPGAPAPGAGSGGMAAFHGAPAQPGPPPPGPPRLIIHAAAYCDRDVTDRVRSRVTHDQVLRIEKMSDDFGDPWPEAERKMLSVLYQYGDRPMEVWAGSSESGKVDIRLEALANSRMAFINKDPGRIVCLIWGEASVLSKERVERLEKDGDLDCKDLGDGGFYPWQARSLICYYRDANGGISVGHGREGGTLRLPWNPLAKWS